MKLEIITLFCILQWIAGEKYLDKIYPPQITRIVGGSAAAINQAPYQCSLQLNKRHFCGCAILNNKWIVTASHCIDGQKPDSIQILVGTNNLKSGGSLYKAKKLIKHSRHNIPQFANDIGLIRVKGTVNLTLFVQPIPYSPKEIQEGSVLQLTGWGRLSAGGIVPQLLQAINLTSISNKRCQAIYNGDTDVDIGHLCTLTKEGEGSCNGDSGGPLVFKNKLVGIVNWGVPCARGLPDAFAKISYYHDWIRTTINSNP